MQQRNAFVSGKAIFLEGIVNRQGKVFSAYVTLNAETRKVSFSTYPPKPSETIAQVAQ